VILATISATTIVTFVGAAFTTVAAMATIVAVVYARRTVSEAHAARTDSHAAHEAEMRQMERARNAAAAQHKEQLSELQVAAAATYSAHEEQMRQQEAVFQHDLTVRRLGQMQRVAQVLFELIGAAREETRHESPKYDFGNGRLLGATAIPALQTQLRIEARILKALGGPDLTNVIPPPQRDDDRAQAQRLWIDGLMVLGTIEGKIESEKSLQPDSAFEASG
jgi:hypothetical protein